MLETQIIRLVFVLSIFLCACPCLRLPEIASKTVTSNVDSEIETRSNEKQTKRHEKETLPIIVADIQKQEAAIRNLKNIAIELNDQIFKLNDDMRIINEEMDNLKYKHDELNAETQQLEDDINDMNNKIIALEFDVHQQMQTRAAEKKALSSNNDNLKEEIEILQAEQNDTFKNLEIQINQQKRNISDLNSKISNNENKYEKLEEHFMKEVKKIKDLIFNLTKCQENEMIVPQIIVINGLHKQMMEDIKSEDWRKSGELMKRHLKTSTQEYKQLNNITTFHSFPLSVVSEGYTELLHVMLYNGLPINAGYDYDNCTMLHEAAECGQYNIAQLLIEHGADINVTDTLGKNPLHGAASNGHLNIVELFVKSGADINVTDKHGYTPLHYAAAWGHKSVVQWLVDNGCDTTIRNIIGEKARDIAATQEIKEILKTMIAPQIVVINGLHKQMMEDIKSDDWSKSAELMNRHLNESTQEYKQLNNITNVHGFPLTVVSRGYTELLQVMLYNGLPINARYIYNKIMLHVAAEFGQYNIAQLLIQHGADINVRDWRSYTPLHWAAYNGYLNIVQLLVESGADINATDKYGNTPLHKAANRGRKSVVQWLVDNGCDTTIRNKYGETARDIALTQEIKEILKTK